MNTNSHSLMMLSLLGLGVFATAQTSALQSKDGITTSKSQNQNMAKIKDDVTRESPFACNVAGLTSEQRQRYRVLIEKLESTKGEVRELADGYAIQFSIEPTTIRDLAEFITYERLCCPFFDLEIAAEREGGPVWLRLRGREGVKEFIRTEFGIQ